MRNSKIYKYSYRNEEKQNINSFICKYVALNNKSFFPLLRFFHEKTKNLNKIDLVLWYIKLY